MPAREHVVVEGEGISKIAKDYGIPWKELWDDPSNESLRRVRKNPNVLHPGDVIHIPEHEPKEVSGATEQRHTFVYKVPKLKERLRIRIEDRDESAMANKGYVLTLADGTECAGSTDGDGMLDVEVPADATGGKLVLEGSEWSLSFGYLNPVDEQTDDDNISGAQSRLNNLGYPCPESGVFDDATRAAVTAFQRKRDDLEETGVLDEATREALHKRHGG